MKQASIEQIFNQFAKGQFELNSVAKPNQKSATDLENKINLIIKEEDFADMNMEDDVPHHGVPENDFNLGLNK